MFKHWKDALLIALIEKIIETVEDRIQNAFLTVIDHFFSLRVELAFKSINASSGRDVVNVTAKSEPGRHIGITAPLGNLSVMNNTFHSYKR